MKMELLIVNFAFFTFCPLQLLPLFSNQSSILKKNPDKQTHKLGQKASIYKIYLQYIFPKRNY